VRENRKETRHRHEKQKQQKNNQKQTNTIRTDFSPVQTKNKLEKNKIISYHT
jgi:hypothetical protein